MRAAYRVLAHDAARVSATAFLGQNDHRATGALALYDVLQEEGRMGESVGARALVLVAQVGVAAARSLREERRRGRATNASDDGA